MPGLDFFFTIENLKKSWEKVKAKSGSKVELPFNEATMEDYLLEVLEELRVGKFMPDPVRQYIRIRNNTGKEQKIGILSVRDKIVQQALVTLLSPLFEPDFLDCSYAYRHGRSALIAADRVQDYLRRGNVWVLETDIASFFESLDHNILIERIQTKIVDNRIIDLITLYLKAPQFFEMSFYSMEEGINIGGIISPILSNIYLHPLDQNMVNGGYTYLRYSDDLVVLGTQKEEIRQALFLVKSCLKKLRLTINKSKTAIRHASEGFVFLGFRFDQNGRGPAVKAIEALQQNIAVISQKKGDPLSKLDELALLLQGWRNYYGSLTWVIPADYGTLVALVRQAVTEGNMNWAEKLLEQEQKLHLENAELCCQLAREWLKLGWVEKALAELGKALSQDRGHTLARAELTKILSLSGKSLEQIAEQLMLLAIEPNYAAGYYTLSELYLEAGLYKLAQSAHTQAVCLENKTAQVLVNEQFAGNSTGSDANIKFSANEAELFLALFAGRENIYAIEVPGAANTRCFTNQKGAISPEAVDRHLAGEITLNIYLIRENHTVGLMVIDIDLSKKLLLEKQEKPDEIAELIQLTQTEANRIKGVAEEMGIDVYIEDSGYRGRHCWFFFEHPVKAKDARTLANAIMRKAGAPSGVVTWELFPGTDRQKNAQLSNCIKLPFGRHPKSGRLGLFVDEMGFPFSNQIEYLHNIRRISLALLEKIIASEERRQETAALAQEKGFLILQKNSPLIIEAGTVLVKPVVTKCSLIRYLIQKAEETQYLPHQDRLSLLHVLAHLGNEGKEYLHRVMACCLNYNHIITQKHINRLPSKPVSCSRLREKYQELSAAMKCNCRFKLMPNVYPSPVLHAVKKGETQSIKLPVVEESLSAEAGNDISQAEEILKKMQNLRKQQQGVENSIKKCEQQLSILFDHIGTDRIVIEAGTLVRKRIRDQVKWLIEI